MRICFYDGLKMMERYEDERWCTIRWVLSYYKLVLKNIDIIFTISFQSRRFGINSHFSSNGWFQKQMQSVGVQDWHNSNCISN